MSAGILRTGTVARHGGVRHHNQGGTTGKKKMSDGHRYFLRTERLGFRCWTAADLPLAVAIWGQPAVTRLIADLGNPSEEQARQRLALEMANQDAFGVQ
jgi:hypothetical protein